MNYDARVLVRPRTTTRVELIRGYTGAPEQNRIGTHALRSHRTFWSFSQLKLLFLVTKSQCWSWKAFSRQMTHQGKEKTAKTAVFWIGLIGMKVLYSRSRLYASAQGRHETGGVLSLFSSLSFDISLKNSVQKWSSDFQGLFREKKSGKWRWEAMISPRSPLFAASWLRRRSGPRDNGIQTRRADQEKQRTEILPVDGDFWVVSQALEGLLRYPGGERLLASRFLSAAANPASCSLLTGCCLNFETDEPVFFFFSFFYLFADSSSPI